MILWLLACTGPPLFETGLRPVQRVEARSAKRCASCHPDVTEQWRTSRHRQAWTNPVFAVSIAHSWEKQWCMNCHAPLQEQQQSLASGQLGLADEGVTCVVCHQRDGELLSASAPSEEALRAHPIRRDRRLGRSSFCAGCHQFDFIDLHQRPEIVYTDAPMQDTFSEWKASHYAPNTRCQDCHMAEHGHRFPGAHDEQMLQSALSAEVSRDPEHPGFALATVTAEGVGHAVPSGDPFRRLELRVCADSECDAPTEVRAFHRIFTGDETANWVLAEDHAVPPPTGGERASRSLHVKVPEGQVSWQLVYAYGDVRLEDGLPEDEIERVVASGRLGARTSGQ